MKPAIEDKAFGVIPVLEDSAPARQYLLIRHRKGHWGFPKGHSDGDETAEQAAQREFQEETGLSACRLFPDLKFTEHYQFLKKKKGRWVHKTVIYFVGHVPLVQGRTPTVKIQPEEISDFRWCSYAEARLLLSFDLARRMLKDCEQQLEERDR